MRSKRQISPLFRTFRREIGTIYASAAFGICDFIRISPVPHDAPKSAQFLPDIWGRQVPKTQERSISIISDSAHFVNHPSGNLQNIPVSATQCLHSPVFPEAGFLRADTKNSGNRLAQMSAPAVMRSFQILLPLPMLHMHRKLPLFLLFRMRCHVRHVSRTGTQFCPVNPYLNLTVDLSYLCIRNPDPHFKTACTLPRSFRTVPNGSMQCALQVQGFT